MPESVELPRRDGVSLLVASTTNPDQHDLALVALRNILVAASADKAIGGGGLLSSVASGLSASVGVIRAAVRRLEVEAILHTRRAKVALTQMSMNARLFLTAGLVDLNTFLYGVLNCQDALASVATVDDLFRLSQSLSLAVSALTDETIAAMAPGLRSALRLYKRLVLVDKLYSERQKAIKPPVTWRSSLG